MQTALQPPRKAVANAVERDLATETPLALQAAAAYVTQGIEPPSWVGLVALLEEYVATWDPPAHLRAKGRDGIHARHGLRCAAPLCTSRRNLESHHLKYRSQGGSDSPSNQVSTCRFHHLRGEHGGLAKCSGKAPLDILWRIGREDVGEWYRNERRVPGPDAST